MIVIFYYYPSARRKKEDIERIQRVREMVNGSKEESVSEERA